MIKWLSYLYGYYLVMIDAIVGKHSTLIDTMLLLYDEDLGSMYYNDLFHVIYIMTHAMLASSNGNYSALLALRERKPPVVSFLLE